ncbi:GNAT family N-acetyltransferase [Catellatospora tritici]|uniref:GNAT family N-acetyltransferase n=1 Tax=Catellatospora tritici TaxID=2851566 RepID=UPI001C2D35CB|nr:GNAT family N-acetyltransferase [Catellatospora tritici]MBV1856069.1 GNAT family N-acetyltransferase [Catellatospora tritici]
MPKIRPYRPSDRDAVYEICVLTAHNGGDARPHYQDPGILPEIFAGPYVHLDPQFAFVLADDEDRAVGYIIATGDTERFVRRFRQEWLPLVADRYPPLDGEAATSDEVMRWLLHRPERMVVPALVDYPAHLHIDLLPEYQRQGWGRQFVDTLAEALAAAGVPAVHLGMVTENTAARAFYNRIGLHVIDVPDAGVLTYLGLKLG